MNPATLGHVWRHDYFAHLKLHRELFEERAQEIRVAKDLGR